jgi:hypothetical protein
MKEITPRQESCLQKLTEARDRLLQAVDGLSPEDCVMDDWMVKDIIGHVVTWNEEFRTDIAMILRGEHPGYDHQISGENNFKLWNEEWLNRKRVISFQSLLEDLESDYKETVQLILQLSPADFHKCGVTPWKQAAYTKPDIPGEENTDTIETLVSYHWRHMNQHSREIESWRKKRHG